MKRKLRENLLDASRSVLPITIIITILCLLIKVPMNNIFSFLIGSLILIVGITLFTTGVDISMINIGESIASCVVKTKKLPWILLVSFIFGTVITVAEPDLMVLASELTSIPNHLMILLVALGIGLFLMIGVYRIFKGLSFRRIISISLVIIMFLLYFTKPEFISVAFDSGGVTTGPIGVPLILAFGYGITRMLSDKKVKSDTFGLCGLCSLGPVIIVLILGLFFKTSSSFDTSIYESQLSLISKLTTNLIISLKDILVALLPILCIFIISLFFGNNLSKTKLIRITIGVFITVIGLTLFLTGVSSCFLEMGYQIGYFIANSNYQNLLIPFGIVIGFVIASAEPAIKILNRQIANLTEGSIKENVINLCLSIGISLAVGLSLSRIIFDIPIIYIIVPGYFLAWILMYFTPDMFVTIAFDSGGAACGALTTSFLLPICVGVATGLKKNVMMMAFGVGSVVALTPIITVQTLGIIYSYKTKVKKVNDIYDESIIDYAWEG